MWGRRRKRGTRLSRVLALGRLEDAMAQAEQQQDEGEPETAPYPRAGHPAPAVPAPGLATSHRTCRSTTAPPQPLTQSPMRTPPPGTTKSFPPNAPGIARATVRSAEIIIPYERESAASPKLIIRFVGRLEAKTLAPRPKA